MKQDILSGLTCALNEARPLSVSENFDANGLCLTNRPVQSVYQRCPIYLTSSTYEQKVDDLVDIFVGRIKKEMKYEPCPVNRETQRGLPDESMPVTSKPAFVLPASPKESVVRIKQ